MTRWGAFLLIACGGSAPAAMPAAGSAEPSLDERLVAIADENPDDVEIASGALYRAAILARDAHASDRERALLDRIVRDYRETRMGAAALLELSYWANDAGDRALERSSLLALLCPGSNDDLRACQPRELTQAAIARAWFSLGELDFDDDNAHRAAISYERAAAIAQDGQLRIVARYKQAWSHYREDRYADALADFERVLSDPSPEAAIHDEALQYIAIVISEPDWDGDGVEDPVRTLDRPVVREWMSSSAHVSEALAALVSTLTDMSRCDEARGAFGELAARDAARAAPLAPRLNRCP